MISRKKIIPPNSYAHIIFRCHNRQFLFGPEAVKKQLITLWSRNSHRYNIEVVEFMVMDNHAHMLVFTKDAKCLGDFMRTVNSQIARYINDLFKRDSQAIRERYKSPVISNDVYFKKVQQYIWLNRYKVDKSRPEHDIYCSASWRIRPNLCKKISSNPKDQKTLEKLLVEYKNTPNPPNKTQHKWVLDMINAAIGEINEYLEECFENCHTVGNIETISARATLLHASNIDPPI